ncbi:hypothetical protein Ddye_013169 [Dipteronia dyeriana]|uniref:Retrotransposon gag domain-containing protein n=1 Tax=Dipteronia dyeriana TaxID=168575 RepID=A0AAD9X5S1_9ROSI|nr:hypothetical protein Ddye_013169 [Dipteronia dyeriana]
MSAFDYSLKVSLSNKWVSAIRESQAEALPRYQPRQVKSAAYVLLYERGELLHPTTSRREARGREDESQQSPRADPSEEETGWRWPVRQKDPMVLRTEDPLSHLENFIQQMEVQKTTRAAMCRMFPTTLTDYAKTWFRKLPAGNMDSFTKLSTDFCSQFQGVKPRLKDPIHLQYVIQKRGETLRAYVERFHKRPPEIYQEAYDPALEQIKVDEQLKVKMEHDDIRAVKWQKKEAPRPEQAQKSQNKPPNKPTYGFPFPQPGPERYPDKRAPPQALPPPRIVALIARDERGPKR